MPRYPTVAIACEALATTPAANAPGDLAGPFGLERFREGRMIDESVAAAVAH